MIPRRLFRTAKSESPAANVVKTLGQIVVVWGFGLGALPLAVSAVGDAAGWPRWGVPVAAGAAVLGAGSGFGLWAGWLMATRGLGTPVPFAAARRLVVSGPYRVVRNPMAVSAVVQLVGVALLLGAPEVLGLAVAAGLFWQFGLRPSEEAFLADRFGAEYEAYRTQTPIWLPRPRPPR